jgi:hypothetical protein
MVLLSTLVLPLWLAAKDAPSEYGALVAALKVGNTKIDFGRLRLSYLDSPEYKQAADTATSQRAMLVALSAKNYPKALEHAEAVLAAEYININAHFVAFVANQEMGAADKAAFHKAVFRGLLNSIRSSGDGMSMEKAWVVISVHEEHEFVRALGYGLLSQSQSEKDGHAYDVLKVKNKEDGKEKTFYFNVDIPTKHETREQRAGAKE